MYTHMQYHTHKNCDDLNLNLGHMSIVLSKINKYCVQYQTGHLGSTIPDLQPRVVITCVKDEHAEGQLDDPDARPNLDDCFNKILFVKSDYNSLNHNIFIKITYILKKCF